MILPPDERWTGLLGADPRPWLLAADEAPARWLTLTALLDLPSDDPEVRQAHAVVVADRATQGLIDRLPDWETGACVSGHHAPGYAPNLLQLLADMGVRRDDDPRIERVLDAMLRHQDADGRFTSFGRARSQADPSWGALLCDNHAITEVLVRFGREDDPRVRAALERMAADVTSTAQGRAWPCRADPVTGFRGPGRKADLCPHVTLEALRTFARLPPSRLPAGANPESLLEAARTSLRVWRARSAEKPYMFGHGAQFKTIKWPPFWYGAYWVLDTLSRYAGLWGPARRDTCTAAVAHAVPADNRGAASRAVPAADTDPGGSWAARTEITIAASSGPVSPTDLDRRALAELAACLVAYNVGPDGTVTPRSCYKGFESFGFGQKKRPSAFATACVAVVLRRLDGLAQDIAAVDVTRLSSSRGGTGVPVPPKAPKAP